MYKTLDQVPPAIAEQIRSCTLARSIRRRTRIFSDTYDSMAIDYGDVIFLDGRYYLVTGFGKEGRFGIDEQLKYWVKKVVDVESGERFIIKCVFYETFQISLGNFTVPFYRNPSKEARVLELVGDHKHFMHGRAVEDETGNLIRILEIISGKRLDSYIFSKFKTHHQYFFEHVPEILNRFLEAVKAIIFLHAYSLTHGDIRRDHLLIDRDTGLFRWIDFDYDFYLPERPFGLDIIGLGNVLLFIIGGRNYRRANIVGDPTLGEEAMARLHADDFSLLFQDRLFNLKKLFPYIPTELNNILLHFSMGTNVFYESVNEFHADLKAYTESLA